VVAAGVAAKGAVFGANERIRCCCIGLHGRGSSHIGGVLQNKDVAELAALCDVDAKVLEARAVDVEKASGKKPTLYRDMREAFADDSIDAVFIATPNHWHSLAAIWACQAGKDVYVEKPLSHNVWEGRQLVEAAKKHNRVVMHGTQGRSEKRWLRAMKAIREGIIGDLYMARALCYKNRDAIGPQDTPVSADFDWDIWQGPAQAREFNPLYVHYNWHWFWAYGNGDIGNQGVHQMDIAAWSMNKGLPVKVESSGGRYTYKDGAETPNTQTASFTYEDGTMMVFEVRGRATNDEGGVRVGNLFYGSGGYGVEANDVIKFYDTGNKEIPLPEAEFDTLGEYPNFFRLVRSRKPEDNYAPVEAGHVSSAHCHLANVAYRMGHTLKFDPKAETFIGDADANKLLTREYREPFVVPKIA
jgi:predicted dehydrogenase